MAVAVGIFEAKSTLSDLIARAERGEEVVITRNGKPVVRLQPMEEERRARAMAAAEEMIAALEEATPLPGEPTFEEFWEEHKRELDERVDRWISS